MASPKILLFANSDWYLWNFRRSLACAAHDHGFELLLVSPSGEYGPRFAELGLRWQPLPMRPRSLNPLRELVFLGRLARLLRRERPALVHSFTIKCVVYGAIAAKLAGVRCRVNAVTGLGFVFSSDRLLARLLRPIVKRLMWLALGGSSSRLILQNRDDYALFHRERLVAPDRIRVIMGSGVDCEHFVPRENTSGGGNEVRVVLAARLLWDKGVGEYVAAARQLKHSGVCARFLLAGMPDRNNPAAVSDDVMRGWVDEGIIEWLGHVEDMVALYQSVDVMVLPSYREGLPKSLIEAGACGLALITCDSPGCREVVRDGVDGLLVPPRDADALRDAMALVVKSPALRARMGCEARKTALERFDERIVITSTLDVYYELGVGPNEARCTS